MKIGQAVFQDYHGIRRYGIVETTFIKGKWTYANVKWFDDEPYEQAMASIEAIRNKDTTQHLYRADELKWIDPDKERTTLRKVMDYQMGIRG
tara:strand:+ start:212 stop:487 length:276 start_codon:yes stop_codon:yes gene_type:complete